MKPDTDKRRRGPFGLPLPAGRRLIALVLCLVMCLGLTLQAWADEDTTAETSAETSSETPTPTPTPAVTVLERSVRASDEQPASSGTPMTNTYMLEVSTGSVRYGGTADNVKYFVIYYTTGTGENAKTRSAVIFPGKDAMRKSMDAASSVGNREERRQTVREVFGYTTAALRDRKGLGNVHTDQLLFTTPDKIETIDRIQIFGRLEETTGPDGKPKTAPSTWACQGMRVYRVDTLYGLEMYGWYSDDGYIDFKGEVIADVVMASGGGIFHWDTSAGVHNIVGPGASSGAGGVTLVNTKTAASYGRENFVGTQHDSQVTNRVVFQIDLADIGGGGFECLAGSYEAGSESKISALKLCETASLRFYYRDTYGCIREVFAPVIVDSLGWTMEKLATGDNKGDVAIAAYAQQGDSIAVSLMLPDFKELTSVEEPDGVTTAVELGIGEAKAREKTRMQTDSGADQSIRRTRVAAADNEVVSYTCVAAYQDVTVKIEHDSAMLRYSFTAGAQEPGASIVAGAVEGVDLDAGSTSVLPMVSYREDLKLKPGDKREYYLVTITTDNVVNAGTAKDIYLQFRFLNMRDKEDTTQPLRVRDYAAQFYGEWPGSVSNFAYNYGLRTGGTIQMIIPIQNVKQFRTVSVKVEGADEWQFKGIHVQRCTSWGPRTVHWQEINQEWNNGQNLKSHVMITREVTAMSACFKCGKIYPNPDDAPDPKDPESGWTPGNLVQDDGKYHEFDGSSTEVSDEEPFDWSDYRNYMTYEDTLRDLGFDKQRCLYTVTVKVAGNKVNAGNDDCGSANLFYFQLIFENGKSGCVLANQQLQADAFRTGAEAHFDIPTTQDYGELTSIRIIPDDQDSNSDIYDKLKIQYIKVKKQSTGKISPTWTCDSGSDEGLGWVGINYQDPGAVGSNRGTEGRTISEIAHTFEVTKTSYSAKLLVAITTGPYGSKAATNAYGETYIVNHPILEGGMSMSYEYYDHNGQRQVVDPVDIIKLMNDYSGLEDNYTRTVGGVTETMDFCVSNPNYQFRPGTQDKFYVDVDDISQLTSMTLQIRGSLTTYWTIDNVSVYLVQGPGSRYINGNGEYDFKYPEGQDLSLRCTWNRPQSLTKDIPIYHPPSDDPEHPVLGSGTVTISIGFNENDFPLGEDSWVSKVAREPNSKDDVLNLYVYPSTESASTETDKYSLAAEILYTDTVTQSALRIGTGSMNLTEDSTGRPVFYAMGLNANYFESLTGVNVKTDSVRPVHVPISYAVLQRVRDGVLIDSYYLMGGGNADLGITLKAVQAPGGQNIQRVLLQLSQDTVEQVLAAEERDLAVAIYFTTDGPNAGELRTKYIYLTDQDYKTISPGELIEVDFCIDNLADIRGINLVCMGRLEVGVDNAEILEQNANGIMRQKWSFEGRMSPTRSPSRFNTNGLVTLLDVDLTTALSDSTVNSGTDGPVRMTVGYLDQTLNLRTETIEDVRDYISGTGGCFQAGGTDHIRVLIPNLNELRWIELEPLNDGTSMLSAAWKVDTLSAMLDLSGITVSRLLNQLIVEGEPLRVSLADILLAGTVSIITDPTQTGNAAGDALIPTGGSLDLALNPGEGIVIVPRIQGSKEGTSVTINRLDLNTGGLGRVELVDTRGYTQEILDAYAANAEENGYYEEAAVWRSLVPDEGFWEVTDYYDPVSETSMTDTIVFMPPRNYTDTYMAYRITITSRENAAATVWVDITVPNETNPVDQLIAEARARDEDAMSTHEHTIQYVAPVAPTCATGGNIGYYYCYVCGSYFADAAGEEEITLDQVVLNATGNHTYGGYVTNNNGTHSKTCSSCGAKETVSCTFTDVVTQPTTTEGGYTTHTCSVCGYSYRDSYTEPLPTEPPDTEPPDTEPPDTEPPDTEPGTTEEPAPPIDTTEPADPGSPGAGEGNG